MAYDDAGILNVQQPASPDHDEVHVLRNNRLPLLPENVIDFGLVGLLHLMSGVLFRYFCSTVNDTLSSHIYGKLIKFMMEFIMNVRRKNIISLYTKST